MKSPNRFLISIGAVALFLAFALMPAKITRVESAGAQEPKKEQDDQEPGPTAAQNGLPDAPVEKLAADPNDPSRNTIFAATDLGVYRTTDGGAHWSLFESHLPQVRVTDLYLPPDGSFLRIATYGRGVWEIRFRS